MASPGSGTPHWLTVRPFRVLDCASIRQQVQAWIAAPYSEMVLPALETALGGGTREAHGLAAHAGDVLRGVVVFGDVAGTAGTTRLHLVVVAPDARLAGVGRALVSAAGDALARTGGRLLMAEVPDDLTLAAAHGFLPRCGFVEEARVPDFYRDGVALVFLRRRLRVDG